VLAAVNRAIRARTGQAKVQRRLVLPEDVAPLDLLLLKVDDRPATRAVMTCVLVLPGPPARDRLVPAFERASRAYPRMRQKVVHSSLAGRSSWVTDADFDLSYHLRSIGAPGDGTLSAVLDWLGRGFTAPLDPARPLWEAVLVEHLADGRAAVVLRAHHAIADGVRAIQMMAGLLDLEPDNPSARSPELTDDPREVGPGVADVVRTLERAVWDHPRGLSTAALAWVNAQRRPLRTLRDGVAYTRSLRRILDSGGASPSPLLAARSPSRRLGVVELPLDDVKRTAKAHGVTVNDMYLAGLTGAMRRYHEAFHHEPGDVAIALPIDVSGEASPHTGNHISAAVIPGPASVAEPLERLRTIHDVVTSRRQEPGLDGLARLAPGLRRMPSRLAVAAVRAHARRIDLQASNVPGPPCPLYLAGQRVENLYAFGPLPGVPVMSVLVSYHQTCTIGFTVDPAAVSDVDLFLECVRAAFRELLGDPTPV